MRKIDPQLEFLLEGGPTALSSTGDVDASFERFGFTPSDEKPTGRRKKGDVPPGTVTVLVQAAGDPEALEAAGLTIQSIAGDVVTGTIALTDVASLDAIEEVERIEAARSMHPELDLAVVESQVQLVHVGPPGRRGAGVIVGICDSGCDFTHPSFRRPDGTSRILFIWDQFLAPAVGEASPPGFGYGVEYSNAQINAALAAAAPFAMVRHRDPGGHGTHVTGIAAGDGSEPGQGQPGGTFIGVAPEADIIVVANRSNGAEGLGTSASTLDAVNYIFQHATTLSRPCVVNMSLGDNLGPHDGTSLLERGLDNLLGGPGQAFVKSAGNAGAAMCHAEGAVAPGATEDVRFNQPLNDTTANQIDLWYRGGDTFRVSVIDPAGNVVGPVNVGNVTTVTLPGGNTVRVDHRNNDPFNGDRRVFMTFTPGAMGTMRAGNWTIRIVSVMSPAGGRFDAWIQRGTVVPTFLAPHESNARTISTPGNAIEVITAGNYVTRGAGVGSLATSSSRGPTRDGRPAPTVAAPGMWIMSADGESSGGDPYRLDAGTSMAAPHVTGTIALMLQKNGSRTQDELRACLQSTARTDVQTGPVPNTAWGAGKIDANAAVNCTPSPLPTRSVVLTTCPPSIVRECLSVPKISCFRSVFTECRSVPWTACLEPSVPRKACPDPSVPPTFCPESVPQTTCPSPSVPKNTCPLTSVPWVTCLEPSVPPVTCGPVSVMDCPSAIDGCPSTPGGCGIVVGRPPFGTVTPAGLPLQWLTDAADEAFEAEVPEQGYFDYDEGWFDK